MRIRRKSRSRPNRANRTPAAATRCAARLRMADLDQQHRPLNTLARRLLDRGGDGGAARGPRLRVAPTRAPAEQLLAAMRTVKAARFNAAERLERKHMLSLFAMSMVSLYFVGLSVWQAVYAPTLDEAANRLITLVSIMSSIFSLVLALIESMNDYRMKAHHMHACALAVNDLYHEFKLMRPATPASAGVPPPLQRGGAPLPLQSRAHRLPDGQGGRRRRPLGARGPGRAYATLLDVYVLYGLCLLAPPLVLVVWA